MEVSISLQTLATALTPSLIIAFMTDYFVREQRYFVGLASTLLNSVVLIFFGWFMVSISHLDIDFITTVIHAVPLLMTASFLLLLGLEKILRASFINTSPAFSNFCRALANLPYLILAADFLIMAYIRHF